MLGGEGVGGEGVRARAINQGFYRWLSLFSLFHAEGNALMEAFYQVGDKMPKKVTLFVDRATCPNCRAHLPKLAETMGIETLNVETKEAGMSGIIEVGKKWRYLE